MPAIRAMFEASRLSSWQQFPVGHINLRWTGGVDLVDLGIVSAHENRDIERQALPEVASDPASSDLLNLAAQAFARAHCGATHQVCLLLTPSFNRSHQDITEPGFRGARISGAILGADRERLGGTVSLAADGIGVTHEVGHSFGLVHMPLRVDGNDDFVGYDQDGGIFPGIDGIRMAPSGLSGNIKSSETGNSETRHHLAPLMFPRIMGEDAQFILVANYQIITRSIYGAGGPGERFGPERSGLGRFERSTYADIRNELTRSQATFNEPAGGNSESVVLPLSLGRAEEGSTVEGIALGLSFVTEGVTEGDTARPAFAHSLRAEAAVPLDNLTESAGPRFTLTLHARGEAILARDLTLRPTEALADRTGAGIVTDLDLFLPLDPASRDRIDRITLSDAGGRVLFDHALPELPDRVEQTLLPDGTLLFNWDRAAAYIPAPAAVISVTPQGSETAIPAGIARNLWKLDPDALGISGPATVTLRFDTGLQSREFTLPVTLAPRLISQLAMIAGDGPRPDIVIAFNRPLGPDLPAFTLQGAGADPIPATPLALGDRLVLVPTSDMAPCGRWRIVADGPLRDADGQGLSGRAEWTVDRDGPGCGTAAATPRADATLSAGGRAQDLTGSATLGPEGAILLDLGALAVRIEAPDPGIHGLIAVAPGATRRDLILRFGPGGSGQGELVLETAPGGTSARFTATWDGRELTGTFSLAE
ncbi:MAG: hypothetical protein JJT81_02830 [Rubellimicrobium sp.]|nr:hypothetical protein [Rubellimicrobium sp.]